MFASPGLDDAVALGPALAPDARLTHAGLTHDVGLTDDVRLASDDGLTPEGATSTGRAPLPTPGSVDPAAPALIDADGTVLTHADLRARVEAAVSALPPASDGRRLVQVLLRPRIEDVVGYLAVLEAGHVALVTPPDGPAAARLADAWTPDLVLAGEHPHPHVPGWSSQVAPPAGPRHLLHRDLALLLSTSGSTGSPKLARLSAANVTSNATAIAQALGLTGTDRGVTSLPLHYCFGLSVLHSHLVAGASVVLTDASVLEPAFWELFDAQAVTTLPVVPHLVDLMDTLGALERPHPGLRLVTQAGGRLAPDAVRRLAALGRTHGWGLAVMYGQTEATARICVHDPARAHAAPDAVGCPVPGTTLRLDPSVPEADPAAGTGEVVVRGPGVMLGYAEHPDDLALGRMVEELRTGDLGRLDRDGVLRIVGRRSGFVKVLGLRIDLAQVEQVLESDGFRCCVSGGDDGLRVLVEPSSTGRTTGSASARRSGPAPCPHESQGPDPADAQQAAAVRLAAARVCGLGPGHVEVATGRLVRRSNGKIDRAACEAAVRALTAAASADADRAAGSGDRAAITRTRAAGADADGVPDPGRTALRDRVARELNAVLGRHRIDLDRSFVAQGGDSLSHVQASSRLSGLLGPLPPDWHHRPLGALVDDRARPASPRDDTSPARWPVRFVALETSVVLRALAVLLICASHAELFRILGGAHTLLVIAGYNAARFGLSAPTVPQQWRNTARLVAGFAVPTVVVALVGLSYGRYGWPNVLLMNWLLGEIAYRNNNELWFVDALFACLLLTTALLSLPRVRRAWLADPWRVAIVLVALGLVPRFLILANFDGVLRGMLPTVFWLFAVGVALANAHTPTRRWATLAVMLPGIVGFFPDDPVRNLTILVATVALALVRTVRVPAVLVPVLATLAAASLHIYLVQFHVLDLIDAPAPALLAALTAGALLWRVTDRPVRRLQDLIGATFQDRPADRADAGGPTAPTGSRIPDLSARTARNSGAAASDLRESVPEFDVRLSQGSRQPLRFLKARAFRAKGRSRMSQSSIENVRFLTVAEVAEIMRVSKMTVYRLVHNAELPAVRVGRSFRVPEAAVDAYLRDSYVDRQDSSTG